MVRTTPIDPRAPPRPFPAHAWLERRYPFRVPQQRPERAARPDARAMQRREYELTLLISFLPRASHPLLLPTLDAESARRCPWSRERATADAALTARERLRPEQRQQHTLAGLRALLVGEFESGLRTVETPLEWLSRPARNCWLARRAARIGQVVDDLARQPQAEPLEGELRRALAALRW